jgi:hypothetical protein
MPNKAQYLCLHFVESDIIFSLERIPALNNEVMIMFNGIPKTWCDKGQWWVSRGQPKSLMLSAD